jgi:hypothetical protein
MPKKGRKMKKLTKPQKRALKKKLSKRKGTVPNYRKD